MIRTDFKTVKYAFRFPNRFRSPFSSEISLPLVGQVDLGKLFYGLCGGMCFAALDYFHADISRPKDTDPDALDPRLFIYLWERQLESLSLPVIFKVFEWMLTEDKVLALRMSRYEIPKLRRRIDKGTPAVLALIRVKGVSDPTQNHQVLATGYEIDPASKVMKIELYDPNYPGETPTIQLNLAHPSQGIAMSQSTDDPVRGFFIIDHKPPRLLQWAPPISKARARSLEPIQLRWPVDSKRVTQFFGQNSDFYAPFSLPGHEGLDFLAPHNANIYATADGTVYEVHAPHDHPYGYHIRMRHQVGNRVFKTVYAHLHHALVNVGDEVAAGQVIGYADSTGNSTGSHLHLTLKIDGEQTPGYPAGIVDPWPYLSAEILEPVLAERPPALPDPLPPPSKLTVHTLEKLNLRGGPEGTFKVLGVLPAGEALTVLGEEEAGRAKIGVENEWLLVQTAGGQAGFVAAWFVRSYEGLLPPSDLVVYPTDILNLRTGPGTAYNVLETLTSAEPLTVLGDDNLSAAKIGQDGQWLRVQTGTGQVGFVAAWFVRMTGQTAPPTSLAVFPNANLNVRARASVLSHRLTVVTSTDPLTVLGDEAGAQAKIGAMDQWLNVQTPSGYVGFVAAWLVHEKEGFTVQPISEPTELTVLPTDVLNIRAQPSVNSPVIDQAQPNESLVVIETDLSAAAARIGKEDQWLHIQTQDGSRGWVAAWYLRSP